MKIEAPEGETEERTGTGMLRLALLVSVIVVLSARFGTSLATITMIVALVVMIFLHELGHYLTAKAAGMKVTEFFLGFGPKIWSFQRGETEYGLKAIPAGAYVKIIGMSNLEEVDPADEERTYRAKPYWRRLSVAVAGSTMHFIMAFVLVCVVFMGFGTADQSSDRWTLRSANGPALAAGLRAGDRIVSIGGKHYASFDAMSQAIRKQPGEEVAIVVRRGDATRTFTATLARTNPGTGEKVGYLGVGPIYDLDRAGPVEGAVDAAKEMGKIGKASVLGIGHLFSPKGISNYVDNFTDSSRATGTAGSPNTDRPSSVVGIVQVGNEIAKDGLVNLVYLLFAVNMFIGIFNLTPLLPFDGGHVAIATYEKIRSMLSGRRYQADVAKLLPLTYAVVVVLMLLFVTTIYLDIASPLNLK